MVIVNIAERRREIMRITFINTKLKLAVVFLAAGLIFAGSLCSINAKALDAETPQSVPSAHGADSADPDGTAYRIRNSKDLSTEISMKSESSFSEKTASLLSRIINTSSTANTYKGVDVSAWNGANLNWSKAKADGVKFAIIRCGGRYLKTGNYFPDAYYEKNITNASKAGIKVGSYFYSEATTEAEAKAEANYVVKLLKPYKSKINMPVAWDMEDPGTTGDEKTHWAKGNVSKAQVVKNYKAFAKIIKDNGYTPMFYSYTYWCKSHVDMTALKKLGYPFWLAEYTSAAKPAAFHSIYGTARPYEFWQYTSSGKVSGFNSSVSVDMNRWYSSDLSKYTKGSFAGKVTVTVKPASDTAANVSWSKVTGATKHQIQRKSGSGSYSTIKSGVTGTSFKDTGLKPNTSYTYRVLAIKGSDPGVWSDAKTVKTMGSLKSAPSITKAAASKKTIQTSWNKVYRATSYRVTATDTATKKTVSVTTTGTSATIKGLSYGKTYKVSVIPYKDKTAGASGSKNVKMEALFTAKATGLKAQKATKKYVIVTWTKASGASKYEVYSGTSSTKLSKVNTTTGNTFKDTSVTYGAGKIYKIRAIKNAQSTNSAVRRLYSYTPYDIFDKDGKRVAGSIAGTFYLSDGSKAKTPVTKSGVISPTTDGTSGWNMRKSASGSAAIVKKLIKPGTKVNSIEKISDPVNGKRWYYCKVGSSKGWIIEDGIKRK